MRVWDLAPGYLNRQSLLGEHRELHGLHSILVNGKRGYSRHPETVRWVGCRDALAMRHALLAAEMRLRGYVDRTPIDEGRRGATWPAVFVDAPLAQVELLRSKYRTRASGRIPLPRSPRQIWEQHALSILARDPALHRSLGRRVARVRSRGAFASLAEELILALRRPPSRRGLEIALDRMWGLVAGRATAEERRSADATPAGALAEIRELALRFRERPLIESTALGELAAFVDAT